MAAAAAKRLAVIDLLLQRGANPNAMDSYDTSALGETVVLGWDEGSLRLLEAGADPDIGYALHIACGLRPTMVRALLDAGADPNRVIEDKPENVRRRNSMYGTPLHRIVELPQGGKLEALKLLLDAGACVNAGDAFGRTPLDRASTPEMRALLISRGGRSFPGPHPIHETGLGSPNGSGPTMISGVVCGALAYPIPGNRGAVVPDQPPSPRLRLSQILQPLLLAATNVSGFSPDLSRVVVAVRTNQAGGQRIETHHGAGLILGNMTAAQDPETGYLTWQRAGPLFMTTNDVLAILASGDPAKDVEISADAFTQIYVPFKAREKSAKPTPRPAWVVAPKGAGLVTVLGEVQRPGNIEMGPGKPMDLVQVIAASGGLTKNANRKRIVLRRGQNVKQIDIDAAMTNRVPVEPGDIIEVKQQVF